MSNIRNVVPGWWKLPVTRLLTLFRVVGVRCHVCQSVLEDEYEREDEDDILFSSFYSSSSSFSYSGAVQ